MARPLQRILNYFTREIENPYIRENFQRIREYFRDEPILRSQFTFVTETFTNTASTTFDVPHGLSFTPTDIIFLSVTDDDAATVTFNYDDFTDSTISVTVSAACTIRLFAGRYQGA